MAIGDDPGSAEPTISISHRASGGDVLFQVIEKMIGRVSDIVVHRFP